MGEGLGVAEPRSGGSQGMEEFLELLGGHVLVGVDDVALVLVLRQWGGGSTQGPQGGVNRKSWKRTQRASQRTVGAGSAPVPSSAPAQDENSL